MAISRVAVLFIFLLGFNCIAEAQEIKEPVTKEEVILPDPANLKPNWWKYFEGDVPPLEKRITEAVNQLLKRQNETPEFNSLSNQNLLQQFTTNLKALSSLRLTTPPLLKPETLFSKDSYTLEDWLQLSNEVTKTEIEEKLVQGEISRSEEIIKTLDRSIDTLMAAYLELQATDINRYSKGLEIMSMRSSLAVVKEKFRLAKSNQKILQAQISNLNKQLETGSKKIVASKKVLEHLESEIKKTTINFEKSRQALAKAQTVASVHFGDTPIDKALSRYKELLVVKALLAEALTHTKLITQRVQKNIYLILLNSKSIDLKEIIENIAESEKFISVLNQKSNYWSDSVIEERDLIQALIVAEPDKPVNPKLVGIIQDRSRLSEEIIFSLQRLKKDLQGLTLLINLLTKQLPARKGNFLTWFLKSKQIISNLLGQVSSSLTISLFKINETPVTSLGLFRVFIILWLAWWISRLLSRYLARFLENREEDSSGIYTFSRLIHYGIIGLGLFIALSSIGLDLSNLALVAGALSLGIGFGLQSIVNNFVSGLILLFERNIRIGNFIETANGTTGVVKEINVRTTLINTNDNIDLILPNSELVSSSVINWTLREAVRRAHIPFGVAYGSDKELVKTAVLEAAHKVPHTFDAKKSREPQVWLVSFGDSSLNFELVVWISPEMVKKPAAVHAQYMWEIESSLRKYKIEIPFPQRDLHLKSGFQKVLQ